MNVICKLIKFRSKVEICHEELNRAAAYSNSFLFCYVFDLNYCNHNKQHSNSFRLYKMKEIQFSNKSWFRHGPAGSFSFCLPLLIALERITDISVWLRDCGRLWRHISTIVFKEVSYFHAFFEPMGFLFQWFIKSEFHKKTVDMSCKISVYL